MAINSFSVANIMILSFIDDKISHFLSSIHDNFSKNACREGGVGVVTAIIFSGGIRRDIGIYILWFAGFDGGVKEAKWAFLG